MMNDLMDCKRVYSADGIKLKARHITAIPQDGTDSSLSSTNYIMSKDSTDYIVLYTKKSVELRTLMNIIKTRGYRRCLLRTIV